MKDDNYFYEREEQIPWCSKCEHYEEDCSCDEFSNFRYVTGTEKFPSLLQSAEDARRVETVILEPLTPQTEATYMDRLNQT
jgi:hypothetical protein